MLGGAHERERGDTGTVKDRLTDPLENSQGIVGDRKYRHYQRHAHRHARKQSGSC